MWCWLTGHDFHANPHDRDYNDKHCAATCTKCGKAKWIDFGEYSLVYAGLTTLYTESGSMSRDVLKTIRDPWGRVKSKKILDDMESWEAAGCPMSWWGQ